MKERPILFSAPMVCPVLNDTKTQTRRIMKPQPTHFNPAGVPRRARPDGRSEIIECPYGQPGDRLWVRESFAAHWMYDNLPPVMARSDSVALRATDNRWFAANGEGAKSQHGIAPEGLRGRWRPSIHMPRWASRITLEVTGVRVERLQDISEADCIAEGCAGGHGSIPGYAYAATPLEHYNWLWNSINGPGAWDLNPWVWAIDFKRLEQPA